MVCPRMEWLTNDDDLGLRARRLHGHMAPITTTMSFQIKTDQCEVNGHRQKSSDTVERKEKTPEKKTNADK